MSTFGRTDIDGNTAWRTGVSYQTKIIGRTAILTERGTLTAVTASLKNFWGSGINAVATIHTSEGVLVVYSDVYEVPAFTNGWVSFLLLTNPKVNPGQYILSIMITSYLGNYLGVYKKSETPTTANDASGAFPYSPPPGSISVGADYDESRSIYATYTPIPNFKNHEQIFYKP